MSLTMQEIDNLEMVVGDGTFGPLMKRVCQAARRGVEADQAIVDQDNAIALATEERERAEKAEAENKTQIVYRKHDQRTIEFVNSVIARKEAELAAIKENTMSSIEAMKAARDYLRGCTIYPQKLADDLDAAIKAAQPSAISDERIGNLWFEIITKGKRPPLEFARALLAAAQEGK